MSADSTPQPQTRLEQTFERVLTPFQQFIADQTTSSLLLIASTLVALIIANSSYADDFEALFATPLGLILGEHAFRMDLRHWINDGLMALFFFLIGLEIKRELLVGELRDMQRALPVLLAACGGMLGPALIYAAFNAGGDYAHGWGIPMATDAAFAVGILALLRGRIPTAVFTFLAALAIVDDLGAILVIALFYSQDIHYGFLGMAAAGLAVLVLCNLLGIRRPWVYLLGGVAVWAAMLGSGVHATVAGVLVAATVPARPKRRPEWFIRRSKRLVETFQELDLPHGGAQAMLSDPERHELAENIEKAARRVTTPLRRWEEALDRPVSLLVMPLFALANAGTPIDAGIFTALWTHPLGLGVMLGLILGKAIGIPLFTWLATTLGLGRLPDGMRFAHVIGVGMVAGIGFTMSIFIARLGFADSPDAMQAAKAGILVASVIAGSAGYLWLRLVAAHRRDG